MRKYSVLIIAIAAVVLLSASVAVAKSDYVASFKAAYPSAASLANCNTCHTSSFGLNAYGKDWAAAGRDFKAIEAKDSDGDGATNLDEINAGTSPGDPASKPKTSGSSSGSGSGPATPPPPPPVDKTQKAWDTSDDLKGDVLKVVTLKVMTLYSDNSFKPSAKVTNEIAEIVLGRLFGTPFDLGTDKALATREAVIVALVKAAGLGAQAEALDSAIVTKELSAYSDAAAVNAASAKYVAMAARLGLLGDGTALRPKLVATRGDLAQLVVATYKQPNLVNLPVNPYVGRQACATCHGDLVKAFNATAHASMIQDAKKPGAMVIGNFLTNDKFTFDQVDLIVAGQMKNGEQAYLAKGADGDYYYLPLLWNAKEGKWEDEKPTDWNKACSSCHVTGYDKATKTWADNGVSCEACHGPGGLHAAFADPALIKVSNSADTCTRCHTSQKMQWENTAHATAMQVRIPTLPMDRCVNCHSVTNMLIQEKGGKALTLADFRTGVYKNDRDAINCVYCHDPHSAKHEAQLRTDPKEICTQCHTSELAEGQKYGAGKEVHHPTKEMFEGRGAIGVPDMPAPKVALCADCHMTDGQHTFKPGTPEITYPTKFDPNTVADACAKCHTSMTKEKVEEFQGEIEAMIKDVQTALAAADAKIKANPNIDPSLKLLRDQAFTNLSFVEADGSKGIHNPPYVKAMLQAAKDWLKQFDDQVH